MELNLLKMAESFELALLEKRALGEILDYHIDVVYDDDKIEITTIPVRSLKNIVCTFKLGRDWLKKDV